ncbi:MAG TPA: DUF2148 domain-containing protein [Bacillota bacterium]
MVEEILKSVAQLMDLAARTAPKTGGKDFVVTKVVTGKDLKRLGAEMKKYGQETGKKNFDRDGQNVADSGALLLVGIKEAKFVGLNCGACGREKCTDLEAAHEGPEFAGPFCAWRYVDLGLALGSAAKTAGLLNADNRIMYRVGVTAKKLGLVDADVVVGLPLSATGKSIYFDRG